MTDIVLTDNEVRGLRRSTTPLARLEERVNGEAEARSALHGELIQLGDGVREHIENIHDALGILHHNNEQLAERTAQGLALLLALSDQPSRLARVRAYIRNLYRRLPKKPLL